MLSRTAGDACAHHHWRTPVHDFDRDYWQQHWQSATRQTQSGQIPPNPYLTAVAKQLAPGTALDAGCGAGTESRLLAEEGWQVTGADISAEALTVAASLAAQAGQNGVTWLEADLSTWEPDDQFDLVTSSYAHPATSHAEFYARLASWVRAGGTLLIVGHLHHHGPEAEIPEQAQVSLDEMTRALDEHWRIEVAAPHTRQVSTPAGVKTLHDVVLQATRLE